MSAVVKSQTWPPAASVALVQLRTARSASSATSDSVSQPAATSPSLSATLVLRTSALYSASNVSRAMLEESVDAYWISMIVSPLAVYVALGAPAT